jgi:hypothetical protein
LLLTLIIQILSITCDNASANDAMINHLGTILESFPGAANRTRCFAHILNLVARCIMRQFDASKKSRNGRGSDHKSDSLAEVLDDTDDDLDDDSENDEGDRDEEHEEAGEEGIEVIDELLDGREGMSQDEIGAFDESIKPVRLVLTKVS